MSALGLLALLVVFLCVYGVPLLGWVMNLLDRLKQQK